MKYISCLLILASFTILKCSNVGGNLVEDDQVVNNKCRALDTIIDLKKYWLLLETDNDIEIINSCFEVSGVDTSEYLLGSKRLKYQLRLFEGTNIIIDELNYGDSLLMKKIEVYKSRELYLDSTILSNSLLYEFTQDYNFYYKTGYSSNQIASALYDNDKTRMRFFGGVGGDVLSKRIKDELSMMKERNAIRLISSPRLDDKFIGLLLTKYMQDLGLEISSDLKKYYEHISNSNLSLKVHMACSSQKIYMSSYPGSFLDSTLFDYFQGNSNGINLRFVD